MCDYNLKQSYWIKGPFISFIWSLKDKKCEIIFEDFEEIYLLENFIIYTQIIWTEFLTFIMEPLS